MIAIVFALPVESSALLRRVTEKARRNENGVQTICGRIDKTAIELLHTGVGETICRDRMARFLQDRQPSCLISSGFAGALTDELHAGNLLIGQNFSTVPLDLIRKAFRSSSVHFADLYTAAAMIESANQRQQLAESSGAMAVDMETEFIARACAEHAIPMLSLRVISDSPAAPFPAPPEVLFNLAKQRTDSKKLAAFFLIRPNRIGRLIQFARRVSRCRTAPRC